MFFGVWGVFPIDLTHARQEQSERHGERARGASSGTGPAGPAGPVGPAGSGPPGPVGPSHGPSFSTRDTQTSMRSEPPELLPLAPVSERPEIQRRYNDAWRPRGRNLADTTNDQLMSVQLASNILATGAYFKKRAGRRSSVSRYFFVGYPQNSAGFLKYFKDHSAIQAGREPKGSFDLLDLVRANWDGDQHAILLTQSSKSDPSERGLLEIPESFFNALLFAVHEAEFRRQHPDG